ncbi:MAG: DUF5320 domain-containing protein [Desulfotomaculaceae bacterium]|nr:DUF5320 domain-containing protein [Desulfotomaculaceae bacterium]MDD4767180.1 DUF5320 domain-containing protein [Desulfotomaculaceae bacterium]
MPRGDGTGPMGNGPVSGKGLGSCAEAPADRYGAGMSYGFGRRRGPGCRRGYGTNYTAEPATAKTKKELLEEQKELLQHRLDIISKQLENL